MTARNETSDFLRKALEIPVAAAEAFLILMFCTKSSFLYPFNDWVDANCFFTVGRALFSGQVLYRDIVEQKGLYLYVLHGLASLVSSNSFAGVFLLETAEGAGTVFFFRRILALFCKNASWVLAPLVFSALGVSAAFSHGDSAEELCMPLLAAALYLTLRSVTNGAVLTARQWFALGVLGACVFWIKYTMDSFFPGAVLVPLVLVGKKNGPHGVGKAFFWGLSGLAAASAPAVLYFAVNGALGDLWNIYFYDNLFLYSGGIAARKNIGEFLEYIVSGAKAWTDKSVLSVILTAAGFLWLVFAQKKRRILLHLLCTFAATAVPVLYLCWRYAYYCYILGVFAILGAVPVGFLLEKQLQGRCVTACTALLAAAAVTAGTLTADFGSANRSFRSVSRESLPQYIFAEKIGSVPNATLLNYGCLDSGFYTTTGIIPNWKYFCQLNCPIPGMTTAMQSYVSEGQADFVVTRNKTLNSNRYTLVATAGSTFEGIKMTYYLYENKTLL